ncbi:unnamed protein product [Hydatigera taeniaeformis]|uniref:Uncharacterized protein n=1 Tax=Hydatigena taeniaeformis TaxID=6205 RepID=A0A0R3X1N8_HYDTA|nr:unnamed protein product [Hydatigera taeniaeformis]
MADLPSTQLASTRRPHTCTHPQLHDICIVTRLRLRLRLHPTNGAPRPRKADPPSAFPYTLSPSFPPSYLPHLFATHFISSTNTTTAKWSHVHTQRGLLCQTNCMTTVTKHFGERRKGDCGSSEPHVIRLPNSVLTDSLFHSTTHTTMSVKCARRSNTASLKADTSLVVRATCSAIDELHSTPFPPPTSPSPHVALRLHLIQSAVGVIQPPLSSVWSSLLPLHLPLHLYRLGRHDHHHPVIIIIIIRDDTWKASLLRHCIPSSLPLILHLPPHSSSSLTCLISSSVLLPIPSLSRAAPHQFIHPCHLEVQHLWQCWRMSSEVIS